MRIAIALLGLALGTLLGWACGGEACCRTCTTGKPCGDSCISKSSTCTQPSGCACMDGEAYPGEAQDLAESG